MAVRTLLPGRPLPPPSRQSLGVGPWGWVRGGPNEGRTQFWRGVGADMRQARTCRHGFAWVAAACVSACWGARAPQRLRAGPGDTRKPPGSGVAAAPKLGRLRAPGTGVMGQAGRGKAVERIPRPFPHHESLGCP